VQEKSALPPERIARVVEACRTWIKKLIDPSRRNNLLFFRELKDGTLDFKARPRRRKKFAGVHRRTKKSAVWRRSILRSDWRHGPLLTVAGLTLRPFC
jgi:hypothetical protein